MTHKSIMHDGKVLRVLRHDAIRDPITRQYHVPNSDDTEWVSTWDEFKAAGGTMHFNGDQTEIELLLPEPYKFSIQFQDRERGKETA